MATLHLASEALTCASIRNLVLMTLFAMFLARTPPVLAGDETDATAAPTAPSEQWAVHGQFTYVEQDTNAFSAPNAGRNSLTPSQGRETTDATLYLGARLWRSAELWIAPELDQGFGLDDTVGLAGFPSGEAYKVGKDQPYLRLPRAFVRQTINSDDDVEMVDADSFQLGGTRSANRWVFTVGKFSVTDIFDTNQYAHDPRNDFLNWAAVDAGSFDYAADAWGYTVGAAAEWYHGSWTWRSGWFDLSDVPNSPHLDPGGHEFQLVEEVEKRFAAAGRPGRLLITVFDSRGRMGLLDEAVQHAQAAGEPVDIAAVRRYRSRLGVSFDLEQQLTADLGLFARIGKAAGNVETYEFSDIDRTVSAGLSIKGSAWHRARDTIGVAAIVDGISAEREQFLNAGGLGILVGDGKLPHPGPEQIAETYYRLDVFSNAQLSLDYQWVRNPAYNTDRGPVSIFAVRVHAQF
jgi:high affinity Mn2+ porin